MLRNHHLISNFCVQVKLISLLFYGNEKVRRLAVILLHFPVENNNCDCKHAWKNQHKLHGIFRLLLLAQESFPGLSYKSRAEVNIQLRSRFIYFTLNGKQSVPTTDINESYKH